MNKSLNLVEYGIQNEQSDIRAHVCVVAKRVYVYSTDEGKRIAATGRFKSLPAYTPLAFGKSDSISVSIANPFIIVSVPPS